MVEQDRCHDINAWEQRRLGSLFVQANERNANQELSFEKTISVASMRFNPRGNGAAHSSLSSYKILRRGDIAFEGNRHRAHPFGQLVINDIGDGLMSSRFQSIRPKAPCVIPFWKYLLQNERGMRHLLIRSTKSGTLMNEFVFDDFSRQSIPLPEEREQEKIGTLFKLLDSIIAAEKRKLHLLQERKRSLLKGIFNRTIRFEGFTGVWKQQKLKDEAISISAGGDIDREKLLPSGRYPVIGNALSNNGIIGYYANDYEVKGPAVTVTGRGEVGVAKAREMNFTPVVRLLAIKSLHDSHFLECAINLHRAPLESTGVPQLTIPIISNYKLLFPPTLMEEMSIGLLFKHIDSLIAAVFLKIELLNLKKQSLLQQMFV
ncbi:restriction endonuclease subunit S [Bifidobacterium sp.]|uniref:restriction endonuclease subunit S n=1 Tax=Bifidobacterium sp. TaxID=41200 RepID=UPI003870552B